MPQCVLYFCDARGMFSGGGRVGTQVENNYGVVWNDGYRVGRPPFVDRWRLGFFDSGEAVAVAPANVLRRPTRNEKRVSDRP